MFKVGYYWNCDFNRLDLSFGRNSAYTCCGFDPRTPNVSTYTFLKMFCRDELVGKASEVEELKAKVTAEQ